MSGAGLTMDHLTDRRNIMPKMEKNGMEKLAKVLDSRMGEHSGGGFSFDFGVIKKDYSLVSNTFPLPIPKKDYSVCRLLANLSTNVSGGTHGGHYRQSERLCDSCPSAQPLRCPFWISG